MPQIRLSEALQNTSECGLETAETDAAISEAETEYAMNGELHNARKRICFPKEEAFQPYIQYIVFYI